MAIKDLSELSAGYPYGASQLEVDRRFPTDTEPASAYGAHPIEADGDGFAHPFEGGVQCDPVPDEHSHDYQPAPLEWHST